MAEVIVDRYIIETQEAQKNLQGVANSLTQIANQSKKTSSQVNSDFTNAARGGAALTKQYNGLNLAVSQFARELPNAAQSAQIFFMSIGNNFGQLQDAIARINAQNKELAASGQKTIPLFKQLAASIFSFSSLLNVGVLLLVLYGKEIGNLISSLFKGGQAFDEAKERFNTLNKAFESKSVLKAVSDIELLRTNINLARQGFIDKKDVIDQYNKSIGQTTGQITTLDQAEQQIVKNGQAYIQMTLLKAAANLANEEAAQASVDAMRETLKEEEDLRREAATRVVITGDTEGAGIDQFLENARQQSIKKRRADSEKRIKDLQEIANRFQEHAAEIAKNNKFDFFGDAKGDATEEQKRLQELRNRAQREFAMMQKIADEQIPGAGLNVRLREREDYEFRNKVRLKTLEKRIDDEYKAEKDADKDLADLQKAAFKEANDAAVAQGEAEYSRNQKRIAKEKELRELEYTFIKESTDGIFNLTTNFLQATQDESIKKLEEERDIKLENDNITAEQRKKIEQDFQTQKSQILNKNAQTQRQIDLSQIAVNTAIAASKAIAEFPETFGQPFLSFVLATGALQLALAAAQPLPKFAKGTERVLGGIQGKDSVQALLMPDEAVITARQNMRHPGLARAWNAGNLEQFLAMKYIDPILNEIYSKDAARINNQFVNNNKVSGISDKRIVKNLQENTAVNKMMLKQMLKTNINNSDRRLWN